MNEHGPQPERDARTERDALGEVSIPAGALYGAQTARAARWSLSGRRLPLSIVRALGHIKAAAAKVNGAAGRLPAPVADAIARAAREVVDGRHDEQFVVDLFQTGSGTSSNMNMNEVVANRAAELLGEPPGQKKVHPNDHVNLGQSSNDVMPSAVQLAVVEAASSRLLPALDALVTRLHALAHATWDVVVDGRTHLMRATPIRLGQRFRGNAEQLAAARASIVLAVDRCRALPLGGTAVGTGVNCPPGFAAAVCAELTSDAGVEVREVVGHLGVQGGVAPVVAVVAAVRGAGTTLYKLTNDLRWQVSDALGELALPELQPGSSIMPGKVNPVVCEAVLMACAQLIGCDAVVAFADTQGQFELNTMIPVVGHNAVEAVELLAGAAAALDRHALAGATATSTAGEAVAKNPILATGLAAEIGYDRAAEIARRAAREGRTVREIAREMTDLDEDRLGRLLDPARLAGDSGRD